MKVGIIGLPSSGKTTAFNVLTGLKGSGKGQAVNVGMVKVYDERVDRLAKLFSPKKISYSMIEFVDVAGLEKEGKGFDSQMLSHIRDTDALVGVIKAFNLTQEEEPIQDIKDMVTEIHLTDLLHAEKRLDKLKKEHKGGLELEVLTKIQKCLEAEKPIRALELSEKENDIIRGFRFLSEKPLLFLFNTDKDRIGEGVSSKLVQILAELKASWLELNAQLEMEIYSLAPEEQVEFLKEMGIKEPTKDRFIKKVYEMLDLVSFFTVGKEEVKAWPVPKGLIALKAAGKVHSDMERGFIRAEVANFEDFIQLGGFAECRAAGKLRIEGKDYLVQDGEVIHFRFHVS